MVRFVVGLGNPGRRYARSRHNVGFRVLAELRRRWRAGDGRRAFEGVVHEARPAGPDGRERRVVMLEPHTYMNCSGRAVGKMVGFYKLSPDEPEGRFENLLVVMDDMALPPGRLRARAQGSAGGHKGLADVLAALGSDEVPRLRVGIGEAPRAGGATEFVLGRFSQEEDEAIREAIERAADAVADWVFRGIRYVMDTYNHRPEPQSPGGPPDGDQAAVGGQLGSPNGSGRPKQ